MTRRPRDAWRDQAGHSPERTDASGPDMWADDQPTSADRTGPSDALRADDRVRCEREPRR